MTNSTTNPSMKNSREFIQYSLQKISTKTNRGPVTVREFFQSSFRTLWKNKHIWLLAVPVIQVLYVGVVFTIGFLSFYLVGEFVYSNDIPGIASGNPLPFIVAMTPTLTVADFLGRILMTRKVDHLLKKQKMGYTLSLSGDLFSKKLLTSSSLSLPRTSLNSIFVGLALSVAIAFGITHGLHLMVLIYTASLIGIILLSLKFMKKGMNSGKNASLKIREYSTPLQSIVILSILITIYFMLLPVFSLVKPLFDFLSGGFLVTLRLQRNSHQAPLKTKSNL